MVFEIVAGLCLVWYAFVVGVSLLGTIQLVRKYSRIPPDSISANLPLQRVPQVTVIRPIKGHEPYLEDCLLSSFNQDYPSSRLAIYLCISSRSDSSLPLLKELVQMHPSVSTRIFIDDEHPSPHLGPNPKIRNMSRAYTEAQGDIVWILDSNVWVDRSTCGNMVDRLLGLGPSGTQTTPYKLVHQLPIVMAVPDERVSQNDDNPRHCVPVSPPDESTPGLLPSGARLEEMFMSTSHAKFYTAINTVAIAPCLLGKSNLFRRSHLNLLTSGKEAATADRIGRREASQEEGFLYPSTPQLGEGIDFFSHNICEDHLIGDLLWRSPLFTPSTPPIRYKNHALLSAPLAIQPLTPLTMPLPAYIARRVRWLRVRKFTVPLATLVEPGTEAFLACAIGTWGIRGWSGWALGYKWLAVWVGLVGMWMAVDWWVWGFLQNGRTARVEGRDGPFLRRETGRKRGWGWIRNWLWREVLALPVWAWAIWGGVSVTWRERRFWVGLDMRVHEIERKGKGKIS